MDSKTYYAIQFTTMSFLRRLDENTYSTWTSRLDNAHLFDSWQEAGCWVVKRAKSRSLDVDDYRIFKVTVVTETVITTTRILGEQVNG